MNTYSDDPDKLANKSMIKRLNQRMDQMRLNPTDVARLSGVPQPTVHRILSGATTDPKLSIVRKLARSLGLKIEDIVIARDSKIVISEPSPMYDSQTLAKVPYVDWNDIGTDQAKVNTKLAAVCTAPHSPDTFLTSVQGNGMHGPIGRCYPEGALIFVDPQKTQNIANKTPILARLKDNDAIAFRLFYEDAGTESLLPLNPAYPSIYRNDRDWEVIGTVIQAIL